MHLVEDPIRVLLLDDDPENLLLRAAILRKHGYLTDTASTIEEAEKLINKIDIAVLDYHLGLLDGALVANEIKRLRPTIPIVMLADDLELPDGALKSVDALVTKSDGAHFLWATVHFVLNVKPAQGQEKKRQLRTDASPNLRMARFSAKEWRNIRTGAVHF